MEIQSSEKNNIKINPRLMIMTAMASAALEASKEAESEEEIERAKSVYYHAKIPALISCCHSIMGEYARTELSHNLATTLYKPEFESECKTAEANLILAVQAMQKLTGITIQDLTGMPDKDAAEFLSNE